MTKEEIYSELTTVLVDVFELSEAAIVPDATIYEDLDLDSIDAVDMIVKLQDVLGVQLKSSDFRSVSTVQDVVDVLHTLKQAA